MKIAQNHGASAIIATYDAYMNEAAHSLMAVASFPWLISL